VFSHPDDRPTRPDSVTRAFHEIARLVGLRGVKLHDLRHAHATILLQQGVHSNIVQEHLSHSSVSTTLDIYSHVLPGLQKNLGKIVLRGSFGVEFISRRGVRVVYGDGLENRCRCKPTVGSNPTPSAILKLKYRNAG